MTPRFPALLRRGLAVEGDRTASRREELLADYRQSIVAAFADLLDAQRSLYAAEDQRAQLLGGGWQSRGE